MIRTYLFLLLSFLGSVGFAQVFTANPGPIANLTIPENSAGDAFIFFKNESNADIDLTWALKSNTLNPNWAVAMHDNNFGYPGPDPGRTMIPVAPMDSGFLKFECTIYPGDYGSGALSYNVWADGDSSTMVEVTYNVNGAVSVAPSHSASLTIAPNPARNSIQLHTQNSKLENGLAQIYGLSGRLLREVTVRRADALEIKVHDLPEGAYLLRYTSNKGVVTRRFLKSN